MATPDSVRVMLIEVAEAIYTERRAIITGIQRMEKAATNLGAIPSKYQALVNAVGSMSAADGEWEASVIAEFNKLQAAFQSLKSKVEAANLDLDAYNFDD